MTSFASFLGVVPLVLASGAGAEMRYMLGTVVFAGDSSCVRIAPCRQIRTDH
jgi:multidrug efflux pump subunit AcrB